ncbi:antibiotic biosynthesis monooxygenase [Streptomyces virens]|jgi:heme-degrading monooxygenase HmoA|uniref:Heme-degrading monooxygenase HmoA n=2 Tax=Streptomyces TaxID=1883 RepID=A0AA40VGN6_9ACTN|nr:MULTISPECIES: antibiotic biosynthesis monooxygenase [Streptomyces]MBA8942979.1 heme-degrading monooxygenase HmoA [Streptomyces calvus]MBA8978676.1 heme-degrading monooxygenase HmoA [Streptomyces calvus]MYS26413.1 antibiotic biosynthesis monooxygenase [Streptomyces sp. SID7804]GGP34405.1 monooxygenase [Streptomyces calvus]
MSIVKINVLTVPDEQREVLEKRFAARAGTVESSDGFEWFELLRPLEGTDTYLVYTRWRSEEDFQNWMSGRGRAAHAGGSGSGAEGGSTDGAEGERPRPAASGATLWSFEVVQQAGPAGPAQS